MNLLGELFPNSKVLFVSGGSAILLTRKQNRQRERRMRFADAHAALTWCEAKGVIMVWMPGAPAAERN